MNSNSRKLYWSKMTKYRFFLSIIPKLIKRFNICVSKCVCESVFLWVYVLTVIRQPFVCPFTVSCIFVSLHKIYVQFYLDLQINDLLFYKRFCSFVLCLILELRCYECCHICFKILNWSLWRAYTCVGLNINIPFLFYITINYI